MIGLLFAPLLVFLWLAALQGSGSVAAILFPPATTRRLALLSVVRRAVLLIGPSVALLVAIGIMQLGRGVTSADRASWLGVWVLLSGTRHKYAATIQTAHDSVAFI